MKRIMGTRGIAALILSVGGLAVLGGATSSAAASPGAVTRTFSFVGKANGHTVTVVNIDSLLINARCDGRGFPVVFGFTSANASDLFAHVFDAFGRVHIIKNTSFTKHSRGVQLSTSSGDFDATGVAVFEATTGKVVTVNYGFDNSTTLNKQNVCTVFGSVVAS